MHPSFACRERRYLEYNSHWIVQHQSEVKSLAVSWPLPSFATMGTTSSSFSALQDICCSLALLLECLEALNVFIFVNELRLSVSSGEEPFDATQFQQAQLL
jgi:hypothetical protein